MGNVSHPMITGYVRSQTCAELINAGYDTVLLDSLCNSSAVVTDRIEKINKSAGNLTIALKSTIDILAEVAARPNPPFCVGFAAESQDMARLGEDKRRQKKLPLIIANRAQDALASDASELTLLDDAGAHPLPRMEKLDLARRLLGNLRNVSIWMYRVAMDRRRGPNTGRSGGWASDARNWGTYLPIARVSG
jgi:hypothetical protein